MSKKYLTNKRLGLFLFVFVTFAIFIFGIYHITNIDKQKKIKGNYNKISVVMDDNYPPYIFKDSSGKLQGILVDQWKLWQRKTGIEVELFAVDWNKALSDMSQGKYDIIDTIFINDERKQIYDFSSSYTDIDVSIFYNKDISGIVDAESLKGFTVGVKKEDYCVNYLKKKGITGLIEYDSYESIIKDAKDKKIMVFVMDKPPALYFLYKYNINKDFNYSNPLYKGQFHRAVIKGNSELLSTVESGFSLISKSEYRSIDNKWFGVTNLYFKYSSYFLFGIVVIFLILVVLVVINRFLKSKINEKTSQLAISEKKYMELFLNLNVGVAIYSENGDIMLCNNLYRELFDIGKEEELIGNHLDKVCKYLINPDGSKAEYKDLNVNKVFKTKMPVHDFTLGIKMKSDKDIVWVKGDCIPEFNKNGEIDSVILTLVNITERIESSDLLKQSENKTKAIIKAIPDLFFVINYEGIFLDYLSEDNDEKLYTPKEYFINKSVQNVFSEEIGNLFHDAINRVKETGKLEVVEYPLYLNGEVNYFEARLVICDEGRILTLVRDITERINAEKRIFEMNMLDVSTELYSRNYFEEKLLMFKEQNTPNIGIIICDIDGLKLINDTLGHAEGDNLIRSAAYILKKCCKEGDIIARIGGDEFAIIVSDTTESELDIYKNKIINTTGELNILEPVIPVSMSVGYAVSKVNDDLNMVFKEADSYMYREKLHHHQSKRSKNIEILSKMLEARDFITEGHGERMQDLSIELSKAIGMSDSDIKDITLFAQFHDIGKVGIPDAILFKPGILDDTELSNMQMHTEIGYRIAQSSPDLIHISDWILKHHERWDGKGYPYGLKGEEIPVQCRILAIVDAYDAMTNDRPYRKAMQKEMALEEIRRCIGTQFDPYLAKKFIELI